MTRSDNELVLVLTLLDPPDTISIREGLEVSQSRPSPLNKRIDTYPKPPGWRVLSRAIRMASCGVADGRAAGRGHVDAATR